MNPYDALPYPSHPYAKSHPDRLAAIAMLYGRRAPSPERARILEVGCAGGGNLLPMAAGLPDAELVGIDLSEVQIGQARERARALGAGNVRFEVRDLREAAELGTFDYIVAHGVWSWVPDDAREALLALIGRSLADDGVAFVSYDALPGWRVRATWREALLYHAGHLADPEERIGQAKALSSFLAEQIPPSYGPWRGLAEREDSGVQVRDAAFLVHGLLAEESTPSSVFDFAARAAGHGLAYLADSDVPLLVPPFLPRALEAKLRGWSGGDRVALEQYVDHLLLRMFRSTLLCKGPVSDVVGWDRLEGMYVSGALDRTDAGYEDAEGRIIDPPDPLLAAALDVLVERGPVDVPFAELVAAARDVVPGAGDTAPMALGENLLHLYASRHVELAVRRRPLVVEPGDRPIAFSPAREAAERGASEVVNARHAMVKLAPLDREVLRRLDGRSLVEVEEAVAELAASGVIGVHRADGVEISDPGDVRATISASLPISLRWLARTALLVG